jgi:hypothetical protein
MHGLQKATHEPVTPRFHDGRSMGAAQRRRAILSPNEAILSQNHDTKKLTERRILITEYDLLCVWVVANAG